MEFTRNRRGNYSSKTGHMVIFKPKGKAKGWTLVSGTSRRVVVGKASTLNACKKLANEKMQILFF